MRVDAGDFPTLDANSGLLRRLVGRGFQVWSLPGRKARDGNGRRGWRLGVRLGLTALGELPRRICDPAPTPPGVRRAGRRDAMAVILCKVQVGYRPSVVAGAQLGFPVMACQSSFGLGAAGASSFELKARARGHACRRRMRKPPNAPKWGTAHAVPVLPISRLPRDMWLASSPRPIIGETRCGWSMVLGRCATLPLPSTRRTVVTSRPPQIGRLGPSTPAPLHCSMVHLGPRMDAALQFPAPSTRWGTEKYSKLKGHLSASVTRPDGDLSPRRRHATPSR